METRAGYLLVGIFVLFSILGILGFFLWISKTDFDVKSNHYTIYFPGSVTGLTVGGTVNYLGVPVGSIKKIELDSANLERVDITVSIKNTIPIKEDAYASLEMQGLTGYKFVQIYGGSKNSPLLKVKPGQKYPVIPSRSSGVDEIMTTLPRLANKLTNLVDRFNATFNDENRHRFSNTLKNVEILSHNLVESSDPLKNLLNNANLAMITFDKELKNLGQSSKKTLASVDSAASDIGKFIKENNDALETLTQTGSYEILQTLKDTREMVTTATQFFKKVEDNPRSLLFDSQRKGVSVPQR